MIFIILTLQTNGQDRFNDIIILDSKTLQRITHVEFDLKSVETHRFYLKTDSLSMKGDPQLVPDSDNNYVL